MPLLLNRGEPAEGQDIASPTLDLTKGAWLGGVATAAAPVLAWITGQDAAVQQTALMISLVAIPSVAFVTAVDILARAYVTRGTAADQEGAAEDGKGVAAKGPRSIAMTGGSIRVKASGLGDEPQRVLAIRWNEAEDSWQYWLAAGDSAQWVNEGKIDEFVSG